jgi:hypothetical protein
VGKHPTIRVSEFPLVFMHRLVLEDWEGVPGVGEGGNPAAQACLDAVEEEVARFEELVRSLYA